MESRCWKLRFWRRYRLENDDGSIRVCQDRGKDLVSEKQKTFKHKAYVPLYCSKAWAI